MNMGMRWEYAEGQDMKLSGILMRAVHAQGIDYDDGVCVIEPEKQAAVVHEIVGRVNHGDLTGTPVLDYENLYQDALQLRKAMLFVALVLENLNGKREDIVFA
jgi:hypothetical protein